MSWFRWCREEADPEPECDPHLICQDTDDLVKRYARGQVEALGEIWRRHYRRMWRIARLRLRPFREQRHLFDAEDLLSEAAARMTRLALAGGLIDRVRCRNEFWLFFRGVLRDCIRKERKRLAALKRGGEGTGAAHESESERRRDEVRLRPGTVIIDDLDMIAARGPNPEVLACAEEVIRRLFGLLDEEQGLVASLRLSDLSVPEIAGKMAVSERTVARRLEEVRSIWDRSGLLDG